MSKHTPGPWYANEILDTGWNIYGDSKNQTAEIVATVYGTKEHVEANMTLIAAAPELLEALQGCVDQIPVLHPTEEPPWIKAARAALAKAKGENS